MNCPVCNERLQITYRYDVEIDYCPKCRGIWLDRGELDKIIELSHNVRNYSKSYKEPSWEDSEKIDNYKAKRYPDEYKQSDKYHQEYEDYYKYKKTKKRKNFLEELFDIF